MNKVDGSREDSQMQSSQNAASPKGDWSVDRVILLIGSIAVLQVAFSGVWMYQHGFFSDARPPFNDAAYFRVDAQGMLKALQRDGVSGWIRAGLDHSRAHPPIMPMLGALFSAPHNKITTFTLWQVEAFYYILAVIGLYRLARNFGSRKVAVGVAALASCTPVFLTSVRIFFPKFPMTAMVIWVLDALIRSNGFRHRGWSLAFGVIAGVATLTMMLAPVYFIGGAAVALTLGLVDKAARSRVVINVGLSFVLSLACMAVWYLEHWKTTFRYATMVTGPEGQATFSGDLGLFSSERWLYYPVQLLNNGVGFGLSCLFGIALLVFIGSAALRRRPSSGVNTAWPAGLVLLFSCVIGFFITVPGQVSGSSQYVMNIAALALVFTGLVIFRIPLRVPRILLSALTMIVAVLTLVLVYRPLYEDDPWIRLGRVQVIPQFDPYGMGWPRIIGVNPHPDAEPWPIESFYRSMVDARTRSNISLGIVPPVTHPYLLAGNFLYIAGQEGMPFLATWFSGNITGNITRDLAPGAVAKFVADSEFLILDARFRRPGEAAAVARLASAMNAQGYELVEIDRRYVTEKSEPVLFQVRPIGGGQLSLSREEAQLQRFRIAEAQFENGYVLKGFKVEEDETSGTRRVHTLWDVDKAGVGGAQLTIRAYRAPGNFRDSKHLLARSRIKKEGDLLSLQSVPLPIKIDGMDAPLEIFIDNLNPDGSKGTPCRVLSSALPKKGPIRVLLTM